MWCLIRKEKNKKKERKETLNMRCYKFPTGNIAWHKTSKTILECDKEFCCVLIADHSEWVLSVCENHLSHDNKQQELEAEHE